MGYAAEFFGIFYSQWDYQMVNFNYFKIFDLTSFDEFG